MTIYSTNEFMEELKKLDIDIDVINDDDAGEDWEIDVLYPKDGPHLIRINVCLFFCSDFVVKVFMINENKPCKAYMLEDWQELYDTINILIEIATKSI